MVRTKISLAVEAACYIIGQEWRWRNGIYGR